MNIAVFTKSTTFHKGYGGLETQNKVLCEGLAKRGYTIDVFSPQKELTIGETTDNGVHYIFIPCVFKKFKILYSLSRNSWDKQSRKIFLKKHQEKPYDLVIGQSSWALPLIRIKKETGLKIISILHGTKISEYKTQLNNIKSLKDVAKNVVDIPHVLNAFFSSQREFIHGSNMLIAVSNFVKEAIIEETFVSEDKIKVIHNGSDPSSFASVVNTEGEKEEDSVIKLVYAGRVIREKGLFVLIKALTKIKTQNWFLEIIGDGEDREELEKEVVALGLQNMVVFSGKVNHQETIGKMQKADVFILPSLRLEGFPMTLVEAMFAGLPIIASDIGGNADAVVDNENGYLVKPGDVDELSSRISELVMDKKQRLRMGDTGRNYAQTSFTINSMLDKYEEVFREVIK